MQRVCRNNRAACGTIAAALLATAACATNPATGKRQLSLIGESDEIAIGREQDRQIVATLGLYGGSELQDYVRRVGTTLAADTERPDLPWTFRVVDDPSVNAFALPGGFVYVTRGMMTHLIDEAELAGVLGHEIGHVTARHSVEQMSRTQLTSLGFGLGAALSEDVARAGSYLETGAQLLFLKYSRDDERQADELGVRYVVRGGYDARRMAEVFELLDRLAGSSEGAALPEWLQTHPAPDDRRRAIEARVAALDRDFSGSLVRRADYLNRIDEMVFGNDPRQGFFRDNRFFHPDMRFEFDFPASYRTANRQSVVLGTSAGSDAAIALTLSAASTPAQGLQEFLDRPGVTAVAGGTAPIAGLPSESSGFRATTSSGPMLGVVAFVAHANRVFRLAGYATETAWSRESPAVLASLGSFRELTDPAALRVEPRRVRIVDLDRNLSLSGFARTFDSTVDVRTLALINQVDSDVGLRAGLAYKVVTGGTS